MVAPMHNLRGDDIIGGLIGVVLIGVVAVMSIRAGQQFHPITGTDLTCLHITRGPPVCVTTTPSTVQP